MKMSSTIHPTSGNSGADGHAASGDGGHASAHGQSHKTLKLKEIFMVSDDHSSWPRNWFVEEEFVYVSHHTHKSYSYKLNIFQRIFIMVEKDSSCILAKLFSILILSTIMTSIVVFITSTEPKYK